MNDSWLRGDQWTAEEIAEMTANGLTPIEINALPLRVKSYIHDLETNADPAGTIQDLAAQKDNVRALTATLAERDKVARDRLKEVERLEGLLSQVWNFARDNNLLYRARIQAIMTAIREKP